LFSGRLERTLRSPFIAEFVDGLNLFEIADIEWQSWLLWTILQRPDAPPTTAEQVGAFRANGWVGDHEKLIKPSVARYARGVLKMRVFTLDEIVMTFLRHMGELGLVRLNDDGKWNATADLATYEKNRKVRRGGRPGLAQQLTQQGLLDYRKRVIRDHYSAIIAVLEPYLLPEPETWLVETSRRLGLTPFKLAMESYLMEEMAMLRMDLERGCAPEGRSLLRLVLQHQAAEPALPA
jgi:hypothetical protein